MIDNIITFLLIGVIFLCILSPIIEFFSAVFESFKGKEPEESSFEKIFKNIIGFNPIRKD